MPIFRRKPLAAAWRRGRRLNPVIGAAVLRLRQAHALLAEGNYTQSAAVFGELADDAAVHGLPRAPQLALQAGRVWILAGDLPRGLPRLRQGLTLLAETGRTTRMSAVAGRVLAELRAHGHLAEADTLEGELHALAPGLSLQPVAASNEADRRRLPAKCRYCGGTVDPAAVEWLDASSAACEYCGSTLQVEG